MRIPLSKPEIIESDIQAVVEVLRTPDLSLGPRVQEFEQKFSAYVGTPYAVALSSGTAALHLAMLSLEIQPGDEVITTPFSFVASANCALMVGAVPIFVDIDPKTWNINVDEVSLEIGDRTRAILPVHVFGQPARMDELQKLAIDEGIFIIEDACEALGAKLNSQKVGTFSEVAAFGFYPNKQMTTGEGGMLVTNQQTIANLARSLRNQGRDTMGGWLHHPRLGYNFRLSDINCALGISQLSRIDQLLAKRSRVANWYMERLKSESRVLFQHIPSDVEMSWFVLVVRLADDYTEQHRDKIIREMRNRGIGCSNYFSPIHFQPFYRDRFDFKPGAFPNCEWVAARTLALPFHANLTQSEVDEVCTTLQSLL